MRPTDREFLMRHHEKCEEGVSRRGEWGPCEMTAVAARLDPGEGTAYAVCVRHTRAPMVTLGELLADPLAPPVPVGSPGKEGK